MRQIHKILLDFIESEADLDQDFQRLQKSLLNLEIQNNIHFLKSFLHLIDKISNNHNRVFNFFDKIEKILDLFKTKMNEHFTNTEIFNIFKYNKRILLYLFNEKIIVVDYYIAKRISMDKYINSNYTYYFSKEIKQFINDTEIKNKEIDSLNLHLNSAPEIIDEKRKIGENDIYICELIRNDSITEFVIYVNKTNISLESEISESIYETNLFLLRKKPTLIEYAAFFGSIQIFNYLKTNHVKLTPLLWSYAIHSNNAEMIRILEENKVKFPKNSYYYYYDDDEEEEEDEDEVKKCDKCLEMSIRCHHNDITNYLLENYCENSDLTLIHIIKYYNFLLIKNDDINQSIFHQLCKYDYYILVNILLETADIDINLIDVFS